MNAWWALASRFTGSRAVDKHFAGFEDSQVARQPSRGQQLDRLLRGGRLVFVSIEFFFKKRDGQLAVFMLALSLLEVVAQDEAFALSHTIGMLRFLADSRLARNPDLYFEKVLQGIKRSVFQTNLQFHTIPFAFNNKIAR